jgi:type IX secretion system PorP/SprF family membrane protein
MIFMPRFLFICGFILIQLNYISAQQRPHYTQYILNNFIVNPALAGIENYTDIKLSARNQWVGIDGAPKTFYATVHGALDKKDFRENATSFSMIGQNTHGNVFPEYFDAMSPHHGFGFTAMNYSTGYINRTTAVASYAYHLGLTNELSLSAGFGAGASLVSIDADKISLAEPNDPAIGNAIGKLSSIKPELNAGLWIYSSRFFAGLSAQQIIPAKLDLVESSLNQSTLIPHLFLTSGYKFRISYNIYVLPSVMVRYISALPVGLDLNCRVQYEDLMWVGGNFRKDDGFAAMAGLHLNKKFQVSYSYDLNRGKFLLSTMNRGTHELVLGFLIGNRHAEF